MARRIRWQIVIALVGSLIVITLVGSLALATAATRLPFYQRAYVEGVVGVPRQLNPLLQTADGPSSERDLQRLLFDGLTRPGPNGSPTPELAERWTVDPAGLAYLFTLRPGLRWHDGAPLTADDVLFTVRSIQNAAFPGDPALAEFWRNVLVEQVNSYQIRFILAEPFAPFVAATDFPILPRHLFEDIPLDRWKDAPFSRRPIGSGPFRLYRIDETQALLVPFEAAARGRPALDLLILRFFVSTEAAREALARHDIQGVASVPMPGAPARSSAEHVDSTTMPLAEYTSITFNLREPPLDDLHLRTALALGLDRRGLIQTALNGRGRLIDTPLSPQTQFGGSVQLPEPDKAKAAAALDELGWRRHSGGIRERDGVPLRLPFFVADLPGQLVLAGEIARQWGELGVEVVIEPFPPSDLLERLRERRFTLALLAWSMQAADPDPFAFWHSSQAETGANYAGLVDETLDRLLVAGRATSDPEERAAIYAGFEERWLALLPSLPLYQPLLVYELAQSVRAVELDEEPLLESPSARFDAISRWTVAE